MYPRVHEASMAAVVQVSCTVSACFVYIFMPLNYFFGLQPHEYIKLEE